MTLTPQQRSEFIARIAPAAQRSQKKNGVPASIILAQAILESAWGQSSLTARHNNYFGIKDSRRFDEGYCEFRTEEVLAGERVNLIARFEAFKDVASCFDAHGRLLAENKRYAPAMADADDPFVFAARLYECGYATDPDYAKKLAQLITTYKLTRFDAPRAQRKGQQA